MSESVSATASETEPRSVFTAREFGAVLDLATECDPDVLHVRLSDPFFRSAMTEAHRQEIAHHRHGDSYKCPFGAFYAANCAELLIHLLGCREYRASLGRIRADETDFTELQERSGIGLPND